MKDVKVNELPKQVELKCEFLREPEVVEWSKNNVQLVSGPKYMIANKGTEQVLTIMDVKLSDQGEYKVVGDDLETTANLTISCKMFLKLHRSVDFVICNFDS